MSYNITLFIIFSRNNDIAIVEFRKSNVPLQTVK